MLICDNAIREEGSRKISLIGVFASILSSTFPAVHGSLCVYVNLGEAEGRYQLRLELLRADTMQVIGRGESSIEPSDRMEPTEIVFEMQGLLFEYPGRYEFVLHANNNFVGKKSFRVLKLGQQPGESR